MLAVTYDVMSVFKKLQVLEPFLFKLFRSRIQNLFYADLTSYIRHKTLTCDFKLFLKKEYFIVKDSFLKVYLTL